MLRGDQVPALKWIAADEEGLVKFLVGEKSFNEDRVRKAVQRVNAAKSKSTQGDFRAPRLRLCSAECTVP